MTMRKTLLGLLTAVIAVGVSACGSSHKLTTQQTTHEQAAVATADKTVQKCLPTKDGAPDVLVLKSHDARQKFMNCAVPANQRVAFNACVTKVALGGVPTKARLETGFNACLTKVGA